MTWSLYSKEVFLEPLRFSNGKTQEDIVEEVLKSVEEGQKIIFIRGICGTGKSAIALNIAKEIGKVSIVVPIKNLQMQYQKDYEGDKYVLRGDKKLKISVITGRKNHKCKFLENKGDKFQKIKKEIDLKLFDIFEKRNEKTLKDLSADNKDIPCKIDIKEKNWKKIKDYIEKNKDINIKDFSDIKKLKRVSVAGACPYWCPVIPEKYELKGTSFINSIKKRYKGLDDTEFVFYQRRSGCGFYEQFNSFIDSDILVFNSLKYKLETALGRKPMTHAEIIDECDEFLDSFSNQRNINIDRLQNSLVYFFSEDQETSDVVNEMREILKQIKKNKKIWEIIGNKEITPLKETGVYDLLNLFVKNKDFVYEFDDESYIFEIEETARMFGDFLNETYVVANKKEDNLIINLVTTNLAKRFNEIVEKNKAIILMSGTIHSEEVLKDIFGIKEFKLINAETEHQGKIDIFRTGLEKDCRYSNLANRKVGRDDYLRAFDRCVKVSKKPALVHVQAFSDLPNKEEKKKFKTDNLISREELAEIQDLDKEGKLIEDFKKGKTEILFSTRSGRGIDFPGEECNSIIFSKYPNPNAKDAFWKILQKTNSLHYWKFYKDKALRELWQKVYRGIRSNQDHVYVLSPDSRVLEAFKR